MECIIKRKINKIIPSGVIELIDRNIVLLLNIFFGCRMIIDFRFLGIVSPIVQVLYYINFFILVIYILYDYSIRKLNKIEFANLCFLVFTIPFLLIGSIIVGNPISIIFSFLKFSSYFLCFSLAVKNFNNKRKFNFIKFFNSFFMISSIVGILQSVIPLLAYSEDGNMRIDSIFGHPNAYANMLLLFISIYLVLFLERKKGIYILNIIVSIVLLINTQSRTALLASIFVIAFTVALSDKVKKNQLIVGTASMLVVVLLNIRLILSRFNIVLWIEQVIMALKGTLYVSDSTSFRLVNWAGLINKWIEKPFWGHGFSTTKYVNDFRYGYEAHNDYIKYLVEGGVIGFVGNIVYQIFMGVEIYINTIKKSGKVIFALFISVTIFKFLDGLEQATTFMSFYYFIIGLIYIGKGQIVMETEEKVKIMQLIVSGYGEYGGGENIVNKITENIDKDKFIPYVVTNNKVLFDKLRINKKYFVDVDPNDKMDILKLTISLFKICIKENIKVINSHHRFSTLAAGLINNLCGVKLIHTVHYFSTDSKWMKFFCQKYITVSKELKKHYIKHYGIKAENIEVIYNGIEYPIIKDEMFIGKFNDLISKGNEEIILGAVGRLTELKGHKYLIEAMKLIHNKNVKLFIAGDGVLKEELQDQIEKLQLEHEVKLLGYTKNINEFISCIDVLVMPSLSEGFPFTILEALGNGKYVIATDVTGNNEIINDEKLGCLVESKNPEALSEAIIKVSKTKVFDGNIEYRENEIKDKYTIENTMNKLQEVYKCS